MRSKLVDHISLEDAVLVHSQEKSIYCLMTFASVLSFAVGFDDTSFTLMQVNI